MKKILLLLLSLFLGLSSQAQEDSLQANRYVMRATLYGAGFTNILDTYLSPMEYTGPEIRILRESMRMTKLMNGNVSVQSLFQANLSLTENKAETSNEMAGMVNWNYALHYQFRLTENLKITAGSSITCEIPIIPPKLKHMSIWRHRVWSSIGFISVTIR